MKRIEILCKMIDRYPRVTISLSRHYGVRQALVEYAQNRQANLKAKGDSK